MPRHVRKGDTVMVTSGAHKGQVGEIMRIITKSDKVLIKGVNLRTKHIKPTRVAPQGGVITKEAPMHISKVSPVVDGKPVRVGFRTEADGSKVRVARHAGKDLKVLGTVRGAASSDAPRATPAAKAAPSKPEKPAKAAAKPADKVDAKAAKPAAKAEKAPKADKPAKSKSEKTTK